MACTLSKNKIDMYRGWCANAVPYTEEEVESLPFDGHLDGTYDQERYMAYRAIKVLTEYGIPLTEESDEHE